MNLKTIVLLSFKPLVTFLMLQIFLNSANSSKRVFVSIFFLILFCLPQLMKEISIFRNREKLDHKELIKANLPGWDIIAALVVSFLFFFFMVMSKQDNAIMIILVIIGPVLISKLLFVVTLGLWNQNLNNS